MSTPKVVRESGPNGGDTLKVKSGGTVQVDAGGKITGARIERKVVVIPHALVTATADTGIVERVAAFEQGVEIKAVTMIPSANSAGHASNNVTLALRNVGDTATGTVSVASFALTTDNALTANVGKTVPLATAAVAVGAGEVLVVHRTKTSAGITTPASTWVVEYAVNPT